MPHLDAGYPTTMAPKALPDAVGVVLRQDRERFTKRVVKRELGPK